jgi:hypothetical protein
MPISGALFKDVPQLECGEFIQGRATRFYPSRIRTLLEAIHGSAFLCPNCSGACEGTRRNYGIFAKSGVLPITCMYSLS